jgi:hypothetical protein
MASASSNTFPSCETPDSIAQGVARTKYVVKRLLHAFFNAPMNWFIEEIFIAAPDP